MEVFVLSKEMEKIVKSVISNLISLGELTNSPFYHKIVLMMEVVNMIEKSLFKLIKILFSGKYFFSDSYLPYSFWVKIDGKKEYFQFRFQWFKKLMWFWARKSNQIEAGGTAITYSNKVWRAWNLRHNILYRLHYKYDRPAGMGIHAVIPYRWTMNLKHKDKVQYKENQPKQLTATGWHV